MHCTVCAQGCLCGGDSTVPLKCDPFLLSFPSRHSFSCEETHPTQSNRSDLIRIPGPAMASASTNVDLRANRQGVALRATIPFVIFAIIAVVCRFVSRKIQSSRYEFDDYTILVALIFTLGSFTLSMEMVHFGSGKHLATVPLTDIPQFWKVRAIYLRD